MGPRTLWCLLSGQLLTPWAATTGQEHAARVRSVQVVVAASAPGWQHAGAAAAPGDLLVVVAEGRVIVTLGELSPAAAREPLTTRTVDADGVGGSRTDDGTLQMRVGNGVTTAVGARGFTFVEDSGPVQLRVRSSHPEPNAGSFTVRIVLIPAALMTRDTQRLPGGLDRPVARARAAAGARPPRHGSHDMPSRIGWLSSAPPRAPGAHRMSRAHVAAGATATGTPLPAV